MLKRSRIVVWLVALAWVTMCASRTHAQAGKADVSGTLSVDGLRPGDRAVAAVIVDIPPGFHSQSHTPTSDSYIPLVVKPESAGSINAGDPVYPPGVDENYPALGKLNVYEGRVVIYVPIETAPDAKPGDAEVNGTITYQICNDEACFMPQRNKPWSIKTKIVPPGTDVKKVSEDLFKAYNYGLGNPATAPPKAAATNPPTSRPSEMTVIGGDEGKNWSVWTAFGAAFVAGLLFNVMPCVLPVLPLKAVGFYEVSQHHRAKAFSYGLVFSLGLIAVFAILAMLVLVLRVVSWGELFSKGWFVWSVVTILVAMAMGTFGFFTTGLPTAIYNFTPRHDTYTGNFLFGGLTAILATPCTAPLLPPLLLWAASRPGYVGVPAVVMVGIGMASPYLILSAFPEVARRFPRVGPGAELFKQMMAWMLLAAATYFAAGRLIDGLEFWWAVVAVVAMASLYLVGRTVQISQAAGALAVSSVLAVAMVGGTAWWTLRVNGGGNATWTPYSTQAFHDAQKTGNPVLVKFTANWCGTCQAIEGSVFADKQVWDDLHAKQVVTLKADFSSDNPQAMELLLQLNPSGGIPLTAVYPPRLQLPRHPRQRLHLPNPARRAKTALPLNRHRNRHRKMREKNLNHR